MKNIKKVDNLNNFIESKFKFTNLKDSIQVEAECYKEFFPYNRIIGYIICSILGISIIGLIIYLCTLNPNEYIPHKIPLWYLVCILNAILAITIFIIKNVKYKKILLNFSSSGVNIQTEDNSNYLFIENLNIEDIYPNILNIEITQYENIEGYAIILKCKKSIFLNLKGYKKEFILFDCITKETYKKVFKEKIKKIKKILNLYEGKKDHNSLQNFNFEDRIFFTRNENNFKIVVNSGSAFFQTKFEDNLKIQLGILLIFYSSFGCLPIPKILIIYGCFIVILFLIYYYLKNTPKIIFTISKQGIEVNFRNHIINIKKEEIESIKCVADNDEKVKEMIKNNIIEKNSELANQKNYYKVVLKLKNPISLEPIRKLSKKEFNLFGYIDLIHIDIANLLEIELRQMLQSTNSSNKN